MSTLKLIIEEDIKTAMKEKDAVTRDILRIVKGEIERNEQTKDGKVELSDAAIVNIVKKLIESSTMSGDTSEVEVLEKYLPNQLTEDEITVIVTERKEIDGLTGPKDMGKVMQYFKANHEGTYDGSLLSEIVKKVLI